MTLPALVTLTDPSRVMHNPVRPLRQVPESLPYQA